MLTICVQSLLLLFVDSPGMFSPTDRAKYDARVTVKGNKHHTTHGQLARHLSRSRPSLYANRPTKPHQESPRTMRCASTLTRSSASRRKGHKLSACSKLDPTALSCCVFQQQFVKINLHTPATQHACCAPACHAAHCPQAVAVPGTRLVAAR